MNATAKTECELPDFPLFDVDDAEIAFGASADHFYGGPGWNDGKLAASAIQSSLRRECDVCNALFYIGGRLADHGLEWRPEIDGKKAMRALRALLGSWSVSHEQKEATVALALHTWAQPVASGMEAPSGGETENTGSTEGDSPTAESGDAQPSSSKVIDQ